MTDLPIIFASFVIDLGLGVSTSSTVLSSLRDEAGKPSSPSGLQSHDAGDVA